MLTIKSWTPSAPSPQKQLEWSIENAIAALHDSGDEDREFAEEMLQELSQNDYPLIVARILDYLSKSDSLLSWR